MEPVWGGMPPGNPGGSALAGDRQRGSPGVDGVDVQWLKEDDGGESNG
jgi:hypothetical protein